LQVSPIQIGPLSLRDFEIPQSIRFGGRHRLSVHSLAGGQRTIERLGPDDSEIQFKGVFSGPDAEIRARDFNDLRLSGEVVWLTWESFRRQVIVKSFLGDYHSPWWISYRVSCIVVRQDQVAASALATIMSMLSNDFSSASQVAIAPQIDLGSLQAVLSGRNVLVVDSNDQVRAIAGTASTTRAANDLMDQQSAILAVPFESAQPQGSWGGLFADRVAAAASLAAAVNVRSYVGRIGVNIMSAGR
jgi:hypothetical protein